jgi:hypothetical protein
MAEISDIERNIESARNFAADGGEAMGIRMFDGLAYLLIEIIRELREIKEELHSQKQDAPMPKGLREEAPRS